MLDLFRQKPLSWISCLSSNTLLKAFIKDTVYKKRNSSKSDCDKQDFPVLNEFASVFQVCFFLFLFILKACWQEKKTLVSILDYF